MKKKGVMHILCCEPKTSFNVKHFYTWCIFIIHCNYLSVLYYYYCSIKLFSLFRKNRLFHTMIDLS